VFENLAALVNHSTACRYLPTALKALVVIWTILRYHYSNNYNDSLLPIQRISSYCLARETQYKQEISTSFETSLGA